MQENADYFFSPLSFLARPLAWVQQHLQKLFHAFAEACSTTWVSRQRNGAIRHAALPGLFLSDSLRGDNGISADEKVGKVEFFSPEREKCEETAGEPGRDGGGVTAIYTVSSTGANDVERSGIVVTPPALGNHRRIGSAC